MKTHKHDLTRKMNHNLGAQRWRSGLSWSIAVALLFLPFVLRAQTIIRQETFENLTSAYDDWYADSGVWQMGKPTSGPGKAYRGTNCAATILAGNYGNNVDSRLIWDPLSPLVVPPADQNPRLRFVSWMQAYAGDYGRVLIRTNGGAWVNLSGEFYGLGRAWNQVVLDLSAYANRTVQIAFLFHSGAERDGLTEFQRVGGIKFLIGGVMDDRYAIKSSADLETPAAGWLVAGAVTNAYGALPFTDPQALTNGMRFYRAQRVGP